MLATATDRSVLSLELRRVIASVIVTVTLMTVGCSVRREAWELAPLSEGQLEVTRIVTGTELQIDRLRFFSRELGEPRFLLAITPVRSEGPRDVLVLNHGWRDRPEDLLQYLNVDTVYANLAERREVRPAVVVLPDVRFPSAFRRNADQYPFPQYLVFVAEEVADVVARHYEVPWDRHHWSIAGFSFGGYIALDVVRRYSARFGSASIISSFWDEDWTFWPSDPPPPGRLDSRGRSKQSTVMPGPVPRLFLACGTEDRFFSQMEALDRRLTQLGVSHEWSTNTGGHTWEYWSTTVEAMLKFHLGSN